MKCLDFLNVCNFIGDIFTVHSKSCCLFIVHVDLQFKRATVQNSKTGELETANYRISKSAWLKDDFHPHVSAVNQRVEDITGLTVGTAEELQVVNYGIGGHYEPHFDFARVCFTQILITKSATIRIETGKSYRKNEEIC